MKTRFTFLSLLFLVLLIVQCSTKDTPRPAPKAAFIWANAGEGIVQFTDQSTEADTYVWNFGDGTPDNNEKSPKHVYAKNAHYTVILTVKNPSANSQITQEIDVSSFISPAASFSVSFGEDGAATFTNTSINGLTYRWDFGNGISSTVSSPTIKYVENKKYTVSLTAVGKGGEGKTSKEIEITTVKPIVDFSWTESNGQVSFINKSKNTDSYGWDFGNGKTSIEANPTNKYSKGGSYTVKLTAKGKGGEVSKASIISISNVIPVLADVVDDQSLVDYLPGNWGSFERGKGMKFYNDTYEFSKFNNILYYESYSNTYETISYPESSKLNYKFSISDKVIYTESSGGKIEKYARIQPISDDEMKLFRIFETATSYYELSPIVLTRTSDVEKSVSSVVNSQPLLTILKGIWDQGNYSIYTDVAFDFSAGKNYYNYNSTFQEAKSIEKYEFKVDAGNIMSCRRWNSDFDPSWKKYKVEIVSSTTIKLYSVDTNGKASSQATYTLRKR